MAVHASHAALPYPVKGARYTVDVVYLDNDGDPTNPVTPDTEISKDNGDFADCAEEVAVPTTNRGGGMITFSGAEMDCATAKVWLGVASGPKASMLTLQPRVLPVAFSGTATAGAAGSITLATSVPALADLLIGCIVRTTGGTGGGGTGGANNQARVITAYSSGRVATVVPNWETAPDGTTTYEILLTEAAALRFADVRRWNAADLATPDTAGYPKVTLKAGTGTGEVGLTAGKVGIDALSVQAIWDALASALTTVGSIGKKLADWVIGTTQTGDSFARLGSPAGASVSADVAALKADTVAALTRLPTALNGGNIKASVESITTTAHAQLFTQNSGTTYAAAVAGSIVKEIVTNVGAGSAVDLVREGTAQAGSTSTTLKLDAGATAQDDFYNHNEVYIYGGTGAGQTNAIADYVGATRVCTMAKSWIVTPDNTSQFRILVAAPVPGASAPTAVEVANEVWLATQAANDTPGTMGAAVNDARADSVHKKTANQVTGEVIIYEADGTAIRSKRKRQKGATEDLVELIPT